MTGRSLRPVFLVTLALGFGTIAGCTKPLGIVRQASDGAEALTNKA